MYTPLSLALEYRHNDAAKLLLTHGARADVSVNWHSWHSGDRKTTPLLLYMGGRGPNIDILSLLIAAGGNVDQEGYRAIHDYIGQQLGSFCLNRLAFSHISNSFIRFFCDININFYM